MAREQRTDVDYFPHDCTHGRKMHIIESKYKNDGYATWFKILERLGKANNHYIDISDESDLMFLVSVCNVEEEKLISILNDLAKLGAIDKFLYENHKVIYSQKFVNSIEDAYRKRKNGIIQYSALLETILSKNGQSGGSLTLAQGKKAEVILKEKDRIVKESKEENIDVRKLKFSSTLKPFLEKYGKDFLNDFYLYWTEPNKSNSKFRQELEKTWSLERRLQTWAKNDKNFISKNTINNEQTNSNNPKQQFRFSTSEAVETISSNTSRGPS